MQECSWRLTDHRVDLWRIDLAALESPGLADLSDEEATQAARFRHDRDRQRFVLRRHALRHLLARYGNSVPQAIQYRIGDFGKPTASDANGLPLSHFSVSSRDQIILIALGTTRLGVDVERMSKDVEISSLVSQFFHEKEAAEIEACHGTQRQVSFYHCWTRKEAYVKAVGRGLHLPLDQFRVSVDPDRAELVWRDESIGDDTEWVIRPIVPHADYVGALIQSRRVPDVSCFDYAGNVHDS